MLYNCEWNSPAFLVQFCVLMSLQASCPIFSFWNSTVFMYSDTVCADVTSSVLSYLFFLEQHCIHVQWHCVCWCHFKCLVLSFLFGTALYLCTVTLCVLMSLQASCPIFSFWNSTVFMYSDTVCADVTSSVLSYLFFLEQHCIHVQWHCVCWCHFKCLILSFLFGTALYLCTVTLCVLMSLQASCPIFSFWNSTVFMYSDFIFHRTRLPLSCLWQCWSSSVAVCHIASLPALLSVC